MNNKIWNTVCIWVILIARALPWFFLLNFLSIQVDRSMTDILLEVKTKHFSKLLQPALKLSFSSWNIFLSVCWKVNKNFKYIYQQCFSKMNTHICFFLCHQKNSLVKKKKITYLYLNNKNLYWLDQLETVGHSRFQMKNIPKTRKTKINNCYSLTSDNRKGLILFCCVFFKLCYRETEISEKEWF